MSTMFDCNIVLHSIAQLLSRKSPAADGIHQDCSFDATTPMTATLQCCDTNFIVQCPSLSLLHDSATTSDHNHCTDRIQAKDHAITLLDRPIVQQMDVDGITILSDLSRTLLQNVLGSIALLVDSRLNAYTDVLTRHAIELATTLMHDDAFSNNCCGTQSNDDEVQMINAKVWLINEKKLMIQSKGVQTEAKSLSSHFEIINDSVPHHGRTIDATSSSIRYSVAFDLHIPGSTNDDTVVVPVSFSTVGNIKCTFSKEDHALQSIKIDLDTKELLERMVQQTARSVSKIVDVANQAASCNQHEQQQHKRTLSRSISYLTMPPPAPIIRSGIKNTIILSCDNEINRARGDTKGLDLLCTVVSALPTVVSPHLSHTPSPIMAITPVDISSLDDSSSSSSDGDDSSVQNLSVDQCADIVDVCLFGESFHTNHYTITESSPSKRTKIED